MEALRSTAIGILILLGVVALLGRLYVGLSARRKGESHRFSRYAVASAGLVFLACLTAGLTWLIMEPKLTVLIAALVGSLVFACLDWIGFGRESRLQARLTALSDKIREEEKTK